MPNLPRSGRSLSIVTFEDSLSNSEGACDLRRLAFIDAYGLVGRACALQAANADVRSEVLLPVSPATCSHLSAMGFRGFLSTMNENAALPTTPAIEAPDVVVPLRSTADSDGSQALSNLLWEQLQGVVDPQVLNAITEGVWEMVGNALEHSGRDALIMGQVYTTPKGTPPDHDNRVQVVVGDTGRGIRQSFLNTQTRMPATDLEAINLALEIWCPPSPMIRAVARASSQRWNRCSRPRDE